ncbi:JAB domain-containing protein [Myroides sp. 1354]|uniref:JAB domain-containing protein n=1 Tax=unclassified Myroides TaxID=2642485 RepID=UPI0025788C2F|nr:MULTISPECIES: JAB domain-containing protein [unclassified Myroides]MDM1043831.1 JAB domain-containing protein [Myroides sp. R163-1]MDM1054766.1 JAB domain-containing protein [Myroides sp. 1354]MDM1068063.1 JAB domain-containing protein [Myroides sp. 1372]
MSKIRKPINAWADDDRPREKLMLKGKCALSDAELIAILIGSGNKEESAIDLSRRILQATESSLAELARQSVLSLQRFKGIGEAKAIAIVAALELGQRRRMADKMDRTKITCSQDVFELMQPKIGELTHEEFWVIFLNNANHVRGIVANHTERFIKHQLIDAVNISKGGVTGTVVDLRILFKLALEKQATAVILVHNHPSGKLFPSEADLQITKKIKDAGKIMDIAILDHFIITEHDYYSFVDHGRF